MDMTVNGLDYADGEAPTANSYQGEHSDEQQFFHAHRQRIHAFWRSEADYARERKERVSSHKVTEKLR